MKFKSQRNVKDFSQDVLRCRNSMIEINSLATVGKHLNLSKVYIQKIELRAIEKILERFKC